jgi:hypothetical protein
VSEEHGARGTAQRDVAAIEMNARRAPRKIPNSKFPNPKKIPKFQIPSSKILKFQNLKKN